MAKVINPRVVVVTAFLDKRIIHESIVEDFIKFIVQDRRIPVSITSKEDMRQRVKFLISGRPHFNARQAIMDVNGNGVAFRGDETLLAASSS